MQTPGTVESLHTLGGNRVFVDMPPVPPPSSYAHAVESLETLGALEFLQSLGALESLHMLGALELLHTSG